MGKLIVATHVTLDGVMECPEWTFPFLNDELARVIEDGLQTHDALLLGRVTYEQWAAYWPTATENPAVAAGLNAIPKYVASRTLDAVGWNNSRLLTGSLGDAVTQLKHEIAGDIVVLGSGDLIRSLIAASIVDEYRLLVFPLVRGHGKRLFPEGSSVPALTLAGSKTFGSGVVGLTYRPAPTAAAAA